MILSETYSVFGKLHNIVTVTVISGFGTVTDTGLENLFRTSFCTHLNTIRVRCAVLASKMCSVSEVLNLWVAETESSFLRQGLS